MVTSPQFSLRQSKILQAFFLLAFAATFPHSGLCAQSPQPPAAPNNAPSNPTPNLEQATVGDAPDDPGPLATDVSPTLTHAAVSAAAEKVASWELARTEPNFNRLWTYAALYDGFLAASDTTGDSHFHDAMVHMSDGFDWKLINDRFPHADDMALGKTYLDLYLDRGPGSHDPVRMAHTKEVLDQLLARPDDPAKLLWWWCDALYMAPPVLARMAQATGDRRYLDYLDKEWWQTSASLYDPAEHLYFRDSRYFTQKQKNGQKIFWSRGNGWVMGGLVKVLSVMPADYPTRPRYIEQFRQMADRLAAIQSQDGLWRSGLLDPDSYELPEVSGSAFFTYALAWGINQGILDRAKFQPVVTRAWAGLVSHIYADGRLGSIQPIDGQPGVFKPSASYVYGVGSFLLAASEVDALARSLPELYFWTDHSKQLFSLGEPVVIVLQLYSRSEQPILVSRLWGDEFVSFKLIGPDGNQVPWVGEARTGSKGYSASDFTVLGQYKEIDANRTISLKDGAGFAFGKPGQYSLTAEFSMGPPENFAPFEGQAKAPTGSFHSKVEFCIEACILEPFQVRDNAPRSALDAARVFYTNITRYQQLGIPSGRERKALWPLLSKRLASELDRLQACDDDYYRRYGEILRANTYKPATPWLENGLFTGPNDAATPRKFSILNSRSIGESRVDVHLQFPEPEYCCRQPTPYYYTEGVATVILENGRWVIDDYVAMYENDELRRLSAGYSDCKGGQWVGETPY